MIEKISIKNFTVFEAVEIEPAPGINVFIGDNGTGKTHLLKLLYSIQTAPCNSSGLVYESDVMEKMMRVFLPDSQKRLVRRKKAKEASFAVTRNGDTFSVTIGGQANGHESVWDYDQIEDNPVVYIPVKEVLSNAPGFRSLYTAREIHFEEVYLDIVDLALLPPLKDIGPEYEKLMNKLKKIMGGGARAKNEKFYLKEKGGEFEFSLVAEGMRKLALVWLLIKNGSLRKGATLYWDEPEANLNPSMLPVVVEVLFGLERLGVQIFIATHSYALLKEFDLQQKKHSLRYFALYKQDGGAVAANPAETYIALLPNRISDQFDRLYDMEIERSLGKKEV